MKPLAAALIALAAIALVAPGPRGTADAATSAAARPAADAVIAADRDRISRHLLHVERHLEAADVSHLSAAQRHRRTEAIANLRAYRERGDFPRNYDFTVGMPYFVDAHGVPCAMAYLIGQAGGDVLVQRVAATANNAFVRDLAGDPGLREWLDRNGMTVAEAALVQPWYGGIPPEEDPSLFDDARDHYVAVGSLSLAADALAVYLLGRGSHPRLRGFSAVLAGTAGTAFAFSMLGHGGSRGEEAVALVNVAAGVTTVTLGIGTLLRADRPAADGPRTAAGASQAHLEVAPTVVPGTGLRPGLGVTLRF